MTVVMPEPCPIDTETREMLDELSSPESSFFDEVLLTFMEDVHAGLGRMCAAYDIEDHEGLQFHAHRFRSASASVGALALSDLCAQVERDAHSLDASLELLMRQMVAEAGRVLRWVAEHRPVLVAA